MERVTTMELIDSAAELQGAFCGMILGDGNIDKPPQGNGRLRFGQANHEYALWKKGILEVVTKTSSRVDSQGILHVQTARHPYFTKMRNHFYYSGRKTVEPYDMKILTPLGLAIWYMDDGDLQRPKLDVHISTMNFTYAEHLVMQKGVFEKFNIHFNIHSRRSRTGLKMFYFRLKSKDRLAFFQLINPFKLDCMGYKFLTTEEEIICKARQKLIDEGYSSQAAGNHLSKELNKEFPRYSLNSQEIERGVRNELPLS